MDLWNLAGKAGAAASVVLLAVCFFLFREYSSSREEVAALASAKEQVDAALALTLRERAVETRVSIDAAVTEEKLREAGRDYDRRLKEAMKNVKQMDLDTVLDPGVIAALCLRWRSAGGRGVAASQDVSSGSAHEGKSDPLASGCEGWSRLTLRDVVEWTGLLLDHAGAERIDKSGLRDWAREIQAPGRVE